MLSTELHTLRDAVSNLQFRVLILVGAALVAMIAAVGTGTVVLLRQSVATTVVDGGIQEAQLSLGAVTSSRIKDGDVQTVDLATGSVVSAKIADSAISERLIAAYGVPLCACAGVAKPSCLILAAYQEPCVVYYSVHYQSTDNR